MVISIKMRNLIAFYENHIDY